MDAIIDGIHCKSFVTNLKTGETVPFQPGMDMQIMKSVLMQMSPQQIKALPKAPAGTKPEFEVEISQTGKMTWRDL